MEASAYSSEVSHAGSRTRQFWRILRFILSRLGIILLTISLGVFATVVVVNRTGLVDSYVQGDIDYEVMKNISMGIWADLTPEQIAANQLALEEQEGVHLPWFQRQLLWTWNAMTFQWGEAQAAKSDKVEIYTLLSTFGGLGARRFEITQIILTHFPNTLIIIGTADFILFVTGIPLALYLGRHSRNWLDRILSWLSPLASVPSWVHGILLVLIFSAWLRLLPYGRMFDVVPPEQPWQYVLVVGRHMILPVVAILLNLYLQCVLAWKSFFNIYSHEDYVELGIAKGLTARRLERTYILRPTLPYIITSFTLTLLGFWQMTTALEYFFSWPGIGQVYVLALWTNDLLIAVGIVVIFAYLLGLVVFLLDIVYVLVDPRIRLGSGDANIRLSTNRRARSTRGQFAQTSLPHVSSTGGHPRFDVRKRLFGFLNALREGWFSFLRYLRRLSRLPSGVIGMLIILGLLVMSMVALVRTSQGISQPFMAVQVPGMDPFERKAVPTNALPEWVNTFRVHDLPHTINFDTRDGTASKVVTEDGVTLTFSIDYPFGGFPQEMLLVFDAPTDLLAPFITMTWTRPDGSQVEFRPSQVDPGLVYDFSLGIPRLVIADHALFPLLRSVSGSISGKGGLPVFSLLFSAPDSARPVNLSGQYTLDVTALLFDPKSDLDARLMLVGQVYGIAGTDNYGNDLTQPLLMGAPYALGIGLAGALLTTLLSMTVAAASVWFGGWVDGLVQRISEACMVIPVLAIGLLLYFFFGAHLWVILAIVIFLNAFGSPVKVYRAAFLQVREAPYIEAARAYGTSSFRMIFHYMVPRISKVLIPQLAFLVPSFIFLEATLAIFGVMSPTTSWGSLIYQALHEAPLKDNYLWIAEPIGLLIITGLGFALLASALEQVMDSETVKGPSPFR